MTDQPRIVTAPGIPDEAIIHIPEFTSWDTQAWSCEIGVPVAALPGLRDAIVAHLAAIDSPPDVADAPTPTTHLEQHMTPEEPAP